MPKLYQALRYQLYRPIRIDERVRHSLDTVVGNSLIFAVQTEQQKLFVPIFKLSAGDGSSP